MTRAFLKETFCSLVLSSSSRICPITFHSSTSPFARSFCAGLLVGGGGHGHLFHSVNWRASRSVCKASPLLTKPHKLFPKENQQNSIFTSEKRSKDLSKKVYKVMSSCHVKSLSAESQEDGQERVSISLELVRGSAIKNFNLCRLKKEALGTAMDRLQLNLAKKLLKKSKKKKVKKQSDSDVNADNKESDSDIIPVLLCHGEHPVELSIINENAWIEGAVLKIEDEEITISYNHPSVKLNPLSDVLLEGYSIYPHANFEFVDSDLCLFYWLPFKSTDMNNIKQMQAKGTFDLTNAVCSKSYSPCKEDIGKHILLVCIPKNNAKSGRCDAVFSKNTVTPGPSSCPFEKRHRYTIGTTENGVMRVVTYNLLADVYSETEAAKTSLFAHCSPTALEMGYRRHLLAKEILGYNGDVLCFQEVDRFIFNGLLCPALQQQDLKGMYLPKAGSAGEGCATFYREDKFSLKQELGTLLAEYLSSHPDCADIWAEVSKNPVLAERAKTRSSVLQVTVLERKDKPKSLVVVANTHLYFHPNADHLRLILGATAMRYLQGVLAAYNQDGNSSSLVFCGDFNSDPKVGVYQLYTQQFVPKDCIDFSSAGPDELITSLELRQPLLLESACGTPAYTNFTPLFNETLDYIFIDSTKLAVDSVVPMPSHEEVIEHQGLPSPLFPSDHIALVCDLKFIED